MANISIPIRTPAAPKTLTLETPGRATQLPVSTFDIDDLLKVGAAYTLGLIAKRAEQLEEDFNPDDFDVGVALVHPLEKETPDGEE